MNVRKALVAHMWNYMWNYMWNHISSILRLVYARFECMENENHADYYTVEQSNHHHQQSATLSIYKYI